MNRDELIEKAAEAIAYRCENEDAAFAAAQQVIDAILPQASTVEELDALPRNTVIVNAGGTAWRKLMVTDRHPHGWWLTMGALWHESPADVLRGGPLTVVWQPCT